MAKNQRFIKLFVVLFVSTAFIFSFSHYGALAFGAITNGAGKYSAGTTVGAIDVSGKTASEATSLIEEKYVDWVKNTKLELQFSEKTAPFDLNQFHFDPGLTVSGIMDGQQNDALFTIEKLQVAEQVKLLFPQLNDEEIDLDKLTTNLKTTASQFQTGSFRFHLHHDYLLAADSNKEVVISEAIVKMKGIPDDLVSVVAANPQINIAEEATFSLLAFAKQQKLEQSLSLNVIATGIYQAILPTNFSIAERNISNALPDYATLGYEAKISFAQGADFVIVNPNKAKYILELQVENEQLKVTLKGVKFFYSYDLSKKDEQQLKPKTIVQYSPHLHPRKTEVQTEGANGQIVKVYRNIYEGNKLLTSELIAEDYYPPVYRVEIHGLRTTPQITEEQPAGENNSPITEKNPNGNQTSSTTDSDPKAAESDLWGKSNEQAK